MDRDSLAALLGRRAQPGGDRQAVRQAPVDGLVLDAEVRAGGRQPREARGQGRDRARAAGGAGAGGADDCRDRGPRSGSARATVRHWLGRYGLRTAQQGRAAHRERGSRREGGGSADDRTHECPHHGRHRVRARGARLLPLQALPHRAGRRASPRAQGSCWSRRPEGGCAIVRLRGQSASALEFHHLDPLEKRLGISANGLTACRWQRCGQRRQNACCCAPTATPRSRAASALLPVQLCRQERRRSEVT